MPLGAHKAAMMGTSGVSTATVVLLYDTDHDGATTVSITSDITSAYTEYIFAIYNLGPANDDESFSFQVDANGGDDGYNDIEITSTSVHAVNAEAGGTPTLTYQAGHDLGGSAGFQNLTNCGGNGADENSAVVLNIFNPASTVYAKHFIARANTYYAGDRTIDQLTTGYLNTASAIDAIQFKMTAGDFDATIKMWGVK